MFNLVRNILFKMQAERAHHFTMSLLAFLTKVPFGLSIVKKSLGNWSTGKQPKLIAGIEFPNIVGLAAGFDKDAKYLNVWQALGFGFVEVGTVTPKPQDGNPKPRLFRLVKDAAIINRMGFNNSGLNVIKERLKKRPKGLVVGGNIGKNKITENQFAVNDYQLCFDALYDYVDYFVINVSSPNTPGLRDLQSTNELGHIVTPLLHTRELLKKQGKLHVPVFVKFAPDLTDEQLADVIHFVNQTSLEGVVLTNTTIGRTDLKTSKEELETIGVGGLSGKPLFEKSTKLLAQARQMLNEEKIIIGVGGIFSGKDALAKLNAGAELIQIYTGFVYQGPALIGDILKELQNR
ncbi:MAG: quinone-dependent dihydroorotate dehydrogenase [Bacteroidia bacterium]|nr:quinone-dependent dihydroorotate dehydrogenase [Bacteroidia bacterium]